MPRIAVRPLLLMMAFSSLALAQGTYAQFDVPGSVTTEGVGINTAGDIVGWYYDANYNWHGFLLSGGAYTTIDYPGATYTYLNGINDVGQIVGFHDYGDGFTYDIQAQTFTNLNDPHGTRTYAYCINNAGMVGGNSTYEGYGYSKGFFFNGSTYANIAPENSLHVNVTGITASGEVVGSILGNVMYRYFKWSTGKYEPLGIPTVGADEGALNGVNPQGTAVVGYYKPSTQVTAGFLYQNEILTTLEYPGAPKSTWAFGINSAGVVVGAFTDANNVTHGYTWTPDAPANHK